MKKINYILITCILTLGCKEDKNQSRPVDQKDGVIVSEKDVAELDITLSNPEIIIIDEDKLNGALDYRKVIENIQITPLETNKVNSIGAINKILSDTNNYFIHDKNNNLIFRFDYKGKFINKIGTQGKGPTDYIEAYDITLDKTKKEISVLDLKGRAIHIYTYNGKYVSTTPMHYLFKQFEFDKDNLVLYTGNAHNAFAPAVNSFSLIMADSLQNPISKAFFTPNTNHSYTSTFPLRKFNGQIYFHPPFSNIIWQVTENNITDPITIEIKENGLPGDLWMNETISDQDFKALLDKRTYFTGNHVSSKNFHYMEIKAPDKKVGVILNKSNHAVYHYAYNKPIIDTKVSFVQKFLALTDPKWIRDDGYFLGIRNSYELVELKKNLSGQKIKLSQEERYILENISDLDNPVIISILYKDFAFPREPANYTQRSPL